MKAAVLTAYGDVDKLELREVPDVAPGPHELKVRVAGASINPIDWKQRGGHYHAYMPLQFPAIMGKDASGEIVAVGEGVTGFRVGQKVLGRVNGGYAEFVVAPADAWAEIPAGMDIVDAGALPLVLLTGAQLVEEATDLLRGQTVLVTGATGSVGRVAVFAAKARGAKVYAGVRGAHKAAAANLGADAVVAIDDEGEIAKLPMLDAISDTVGGETTQKLLAKLKAGGTIGSIVGEPAGAKERGFVVRGMLTHSDSKRLATLAQAVAAGNLVVPIARRFPLAQAGAAQALAEKGAAGKVLLTT
jgi:NADPH:quinone reductase-like Zn-dependent oxidoreductase